MSPRTALLLGVAVALGLAPSPTSARQASWNDHHVAWSPDGSTLAIDSDRSGSAEVWLLNSDGSDPRPLTSTPGVPVAPVWSPDGQWLAVQLETNGEIDIWVLRADGTESRRLTTGDLGGGRVSWSPDSNEIALAQYRNVEVSTLLAADVETGRVRLLAENGLAPGWSPDGGQILFSRQDGEDYDLYSLDLQTGDEHRLLSGGRNVAPVWSADGTQVAFYSDRDGDNDIYVMRPDGSGLRKVAGGPGSEVMPSWNPEATRLVYQSDRNGYWELFTMDLATGIETRITFGATGGASNGSP